MERDGMELTELVRTVRLARSYRPVPVPDALLARLLEIARWTGSSRNRQPWHLIVVRDKEILAALARLRPAVTAWVADAPLGIVPVLDGENPGSECYDEGRLTERILIAAHMLGLGAGVAWFGDEAQQDEGKRLLGIPPERVARQVITVGYGTAGTALVSAGRKPLAELVSYDRFGNGQA